MSAPVVFAVAVDGALRVYVRNGDAELRQVSESAVVTPIDPTRLVTLVADLDGQLGWTGPGAAAASGDRVLGRPAVAAVDAGPPPVWDAKNPRAVLLELLGASDAPLTVKDLGGEPIRYYLMDLVRRKQVVEVGVSGHRGRGGATLYALPARASKSSTPRSSPRATRATRATPAEMLERDAAALALIRDAAEPLTAIEIIRVLGLPRSTDSSMRERLGRYVASGEIRRIGTVGPNHQTIYRYAPGQVRAEAST